MGNLVFHFSAPNLAPGYTHLSVGTAVCMVFSVLLCPAAIGTGMWLVRFTAKIHGTTLYGYW